MNEEKTIYSTYVDWKEVLPNVKLSEEFIEKNINFIAPPGKDNRNMWIRISTTQNLTENFIEKYQYKLDWQWIFYEQKFSENFIKKHFDKFNTNSNFEYLMNNKSVSDKIKEEIKLLKEII